MEPNEMMVNEEVVETATEATEEIVKKSSGKGFKIAAGVGLVIVVGGLAVKYVIIPAANKIKAKKQQNSTPIDVEAEEVYEDSTEQETEEEDSEE
jgi:hypothetical protein